MTVCSAPVPAGEAHKIADGARHIAFTLGIDWGKSDIRPDWSGDYHFCSFNCLAAWATEKAEQHDNVTLKEGTPDG